VGWARQDEVSPCSADVSELMPPSFKIPVDSMDRIQSIALEDPHNDVFG